MRAACAALAMCLILAPLPGLSQSLVPLLRPEGQPSASALPRAVTPTDPDGALSSSLVPRLRPEGLPRASGAQAAAGASTANVLTEPQTDPAPAQRGGFLALFQNPSLRRTMVCGDIDLQGEEIGDITSPRRGCGVKDAVSLTSVSGIKLSTPARINCDTAHALKDWIEKGAIPAARRMGGLSEIRVAGSYACRTRNHKPGARLSEHATGNAIDISAFKMRNGQVITLGSGWAGGDTRRMLVAMWKAACGPFGTVLGPNSDAYHKNHFHFDVARHRSGPYCR